jgi:hypothetical protein
MSTKLANKTDKKISGFTTDNRTSGRELRQSIVARVKWGQ